MATIEINEYNKKCYKIQTYNFDNPGLFEKCVDIIYVITMENSKRLDNVFNQLNKYNLHSNVKIQYNKGFKNGNKVLYKNESCYDISDALRNVFEDSIFNNYKRILVFEDDFFMDNYSHNDINKIVNFINKKNPDVYNLGNLAHLSWPRFNNHIKSIMFGFAHAVIYNNNYMKEYIKDFPKGKIKHCDKYWNKLKFRKYSYKKPIAYQTFPETENMKNWGWTWKLSNKWLKYWRLNSSHENYIQHFKLFHKLPWYTITILLLILSIYINKKN